MAVKELDNENFDSEVKQFDIPVLVDFWAAWCGPCQMMKPIFHDISDKYKSRAKFCSVNTEDNPELAEMFDIRGIPCIIVFRHGKEIDRIVGLMHKEELQEKIDEILAK